MMEMRTKEKQWAARDKESAEEHGDGRREFYELRGSMAKAALRYS
jgi:hypothetical protein